MKPFLGVVVAVAVLVTMPLSVRAQPRASERSTVRQIVNGTTLTLDFSRPVARGRANLFGGVVHWGEVWTPGANFATTFEVNNDIIMAGAKVPKGKYGVWMIVSQDSNWMMLLDPKWKQFHMDHPKPNDTHIRVPVRADTNAAREEILTFSFPSVTARGGSIAMHWANVRVTTDFTVQPTYSAMLPENEARPYVGTYLMKDPKSGKEDGKLIVNYEGGGLKARLRLPATD